MRHFRAATPALLATGALVLTACSTVGGGDGDSGTTKDGEPTRVVLVTHESFVLPEDLQAEFEQQSGYELVVRASGDAGALTNKLVLTKGDPLGDVTFGIDNTFASRALDEGVLAPYDATLPEGAEQYRLPGDDDHALTPVDNASVCVNVDDTWFAAHDQEPPSSLDDLADPAYRDLFVAPGAATSSPGMAFLLATIAEYGDDWPDYWERLMANGAKLTEGWSDAYQVDFTQGGGQGKRPVVLSYDSSPAFTIADDGTSTTSALLDTCFRQVEYAGVLEGAENPDGAEALVDFLLTPEVQAALPESMYVFPVDAGVELPEEWAQFARQPADPLEVDPAEIAANRDDWLREWSDITSR
ncbi:thiamine ABC transporter substrate-binding protein [Nocardioides sp. MAH-18]|uniref:Thiamine ABC transporter substrate-binding protein n=1 Tax=Nocardioides agri TaxID=2682843 RepID=A0A6L6XSM7_9ACTN|nr:MULTISPECIES: thiamine ABC transporter substrate-binding protein [unclassified Nocardioides]MBA2955534.1 thiamine ABC transporter substrate-binding protein [Nocardioides sp. CGMCC 1.13656]MVQ50384.1 thiamine ABC transporter substrate-binding protein [Nocardioides sp. MAH-18]